MACNCRPALTTTAFFSHEVTLKKENVRIGRFTGFVEIMIPVFERNAWNNFWKDIMIASNGWGWGYDLFAKSKCGYKRMGIIDCEPVCHTRIQRIPDSRTITEFESYIASHAPNYQKALMLSYGNLKWMFAIMCRVWYIEPPFHMGAVTQLAPIRTLCK